MLTTGVVSLSAVGWVSYRIERDRLGDIERQIEQAVSGKGVTLSSSHALALKELVADNAFSDVRKVVSSAVLEDPDLIYGAFFGPEGDTWAYVSPKHTEVDSPPDAALVMSEIQLLAKDSAVGRLTQRRIHVFGEDVHEFMAPVVGEANERLGVIIYGFSNRRSVEAAKVAEERSRRALSRAFLASGLVGLLCLAAGIAWVLRAAGRITDPLARLTDAARDIARGRRGIRVNIRSGDEVEELAGAFNQMLEANESAMRELEATTERALAADRLKSEFLANTSHEIRTPMNGVLGMVRFIQAMPLEPKLRRYVDTIDASANALLTIINDILDFSKMEAGKQVLQQLVFAPHRVLEDVSDLLAGRARDKNLDLVCRPDPKFPALVAGDPDRFRQILNNLLGNAIKFTDRGEVVVDMRLASIDENEILAEVAVKDSGIGIRAEDLPKLFAAFSQVDGSLARRHGGTGLGLAICKRLVGLMGGEISATSEFGKGSVFKFTVRFGVADVTPLPTSARHTGEPRSVLLLEPSQRWRGVIQEQLEAWHVTPTVVADAEACRQELSRASGSARPFDALILCADQSGPEANELVRSLRALAGPERLPALLVTRTPALGPSGGEFDAELCKPLRFSELHAQLARALGPGSGRNLARERVATPAKVPDKPILVVDDNDINRFVAVEELTQAGYRTEEAANGREALDKFTVSDYLCVLMDCQMPVMDGYTAARAIRELEVVEQRRRTPIIALTAHALIGERERVLAAGMDDFLSKPFHPASLNRILSVHAAPSPSMAPAAVASVVHELDPDAKRSEKLIRMFLARVPEQMSALAGAIEGSKTREVRTLAHKLKGSCAALAAVRMGDAVRVLEQAASTTDMSLVRRHFEELKARERAVAQALEAELEQNFPKPGTVSRPS